MHIEGGEERDLVSAYSRYLWEYMMCYIRISRQVSIFPRCYMWMHVF